MLRLLTPAGRIALTSAAILTALWLLSPRRGEPAADPGVVELSYLGLSGPLAGALDDAVSVFEAESRARHARDPSQPVYRVVSGQTGSRSPSDDPTRFLLGVAGGMPPDVINTDRVAVAEWAARGAFLPLDPFLKRDLATRHPDAIRGEDYFPAAWSEVNYRDPAGKHTGIYAIPSSVENRALVYNRDLLRRAGFVDAHGEAQPPRTWEELATMAARLTERNAQHRITQIGFLPAYGTTTPPFYLFGWMNGGEFMTGGGRTATFDDARNVQALAWLTRLYDGMGGARDVYGFQSGQQREELDPFIQNQVAMKLDTFSLLPLSLAAYGQDLNYAVAPMPLPAAERAKGNPPISMLSGWCYAIPANSLHPEGAWELIRFLASRRAQMIIAASENAQAVSQGRIYIPSQNANVRLNQDLYEQYIADNPRLPAKLKEAVLGFDRLLDHSYPRPSSPAGQLMWNELISATQRALYKTYTPAAALTLASKNVQKELDRAFDPPRGVLVRWPPLLWAYGLGLVVVAAGVVWWETSVRLGQRTASMLRWLGWRRPGSAASSVLGEDGRANRAQRFAGAAFALPWIIGFVVFTGGPIFFSLIISFCDYDILNPARYTGTENYRWLFAEDPLFLVSLKNTVFMVIGIPLGMAVSLGIALLLNLKVRGIAVWRTMFYLPSIVPAVAASILWVWILNPNAGLLNRFLAAFGFAGRNWLQDPALSKPALILMGLWSAGGGMIVWLAGLKGISPSYYEAAELDGAGSWQKFWKITFPMLTPYIFFNLVMGLIGCFQIFSQAFIMTQGGPVNSTLFYAYHLFNSAFRYLHMGYASAMAWVLVIVVLGLTYFQMRFSKRWVHYEGE